MIEKESAKVVVSPWSVEFIEEFGTTVTGRQPAVRVGVEYKGGEIWGKTVTPFFVSLRAALGLDVPKPFYLQRIESARRKAEQIARIFP